MHLTKPTSLVEVRTLHAVSQAMRDRQVARKVRVEPLALGA